MKAITLDRALGFSPKVEARPGASLLKANISGEELKKIFSHWKSLPADELPRLRALTPAKNEDSQLILNLVLDLGEKDTWLCLEMDTSRGTLPDFSAIWPYCSWWQEELRTFANMSFDGQEKIQGVAWRLA